MIKAICTGLVRDYEQEKKVRSLVGSSNPIIKGYTLRELDECNKIKNDKSYCFTEADLVKHIETRNIEIINLTINKYSKLEFKQSDNVEDAETKKLVNKAILLGYEAKTIDTDCGNKCYLLSRDKEHILRIPDNVIAPSINILKQSNLEIELRKIRGVLRVIGGKGIINAESMFKKCLIEQLDLTEFNTESMESTCDMFNNADITDIKFGEACTMSKVINMEGMFRCFNGRKLDLSYFNTHNVKNMKNMFENCDCDEVIINNFDLTSVNSMEAMFVDATFTELDISNWVISEISNTKYIFKDFEVEKEVKLSEKDRNNKRLMKFRACWTPEERAANPKNDWYHQYKKAEKYGYSSEYGFW